MIFSLEIPTPTAGVPTTTAVDVTNLRLIKTKHRTGAHKSRSKIDPVITLHGVIDYTFKNVNMRGRLVVVIHNT